MNVTGQKPGQTSQKHNASIAAEAVEAEIHCVH